MATAAFEELDELSGKGLEVYAEALVVLELMVVVLADLSYAHKKVNHHVGGKVKSQQREGGSQQSYAQGGRAANTTVTCRTYSAVQNGAQYSGEGESKMPDFQIPPPALEMCDLTCVSLSYCVASRRSSKAATLT